MNTFRYSITTSTGDDEKTNEMIVDFLMSNNIPTFFSSSDYRRYTPFSMLNSQSNIINQLNRISTLDIMDNFLNEIQDTLSYYDIEDSLEDLQETQDDVKVVVPEDELKNIKEEKYIENKHKDKNCSICLEEYEKEDIIKQLECKHMFHKNCIEPWLKEYSHKCPLCRNEHSTKTYI